MALVTIQVFPGARRSRPRAAGPSAWVAERARLHHHPGGRVQGIGQAVDGQEDPRLPGPYAVTPHGHGRAQQPADAEAEPGPGLAQHLGKTAPGPRHELTLLSAAQHLIVPNSNRVRLSGSPRDPDALARGTYDAAVVEVIVVT
jgi:hypothetical protein